MDPMTIGVLAASILVGLGAASIAGLKAWNGWLELKRMELTHDAARPAPAGGVRPDRDGGPEGADPQARGDRRRHRHLKFTSPARITPQARNRRGARRPFAAGRLFL